MVVGMPLQLQLDRRVGKEIVVVVDVVVVVGSNSCR